MIGGALGFVDVPGPPALSSSEVAQELGRIYREVLAEVENAYLALTNRQRQTQGPAVTQQQMAGSAQTAILEQRQQIAELAKKAQNSGDPQMQARLQQSLLQVSTGQGGPHA